MGTGHLRTLSGSRGVPAPVRPRSLQRRGHGPRSHAAWIAARLTPPTCGQGGQGQARGAHGAIPGSGDAGDNPHAPAGTASPCCLPCSSPGGHPGTRDASTTSHAAEKRLWCEDMRWQAPEGRLRIHALLRLFWNLGPGAVRSGREQECALGNPVSQCAQEPVPWEAGSLRNMPEKKDSSAARKRTVSYG